MAALVPNLIGAKNAIDAGVSKMSLPLSVSETHSVANLRRNHAEMIEEIRQISALLAGIPSEARPHFEVGLATAFGCSLCIGNALAAIQVGISTLDSSLGGIGGCPAAPGASGNIVTEDLVFMLNSMGYDTGIDMDKLLAVRKIVAEALPNETLFGFTPEAGLPKEHCGRSWGVQT